MTIPTPDRLSAFGRSSIPEIIKAQGPPVVHILTEAVLPDRFNRPIPAQGVGTGEINDERGYVLTNYHVIDCAETFWSP